MLLNKLAEYIKSAPDLSSFHVVRQSASGEESVLVPQEPTMGSAEVVEGAVMAAHTLGGPLAPCFTHFLDGAERTHVPCYRGMVPLLYAFIGAVVRRRDSGKRMSTCAKLCTESLYFPFDHAEPADMLGAGLSVRNVQGNEKVPPELHPIKLLELARRAASNDRAALESEMAEHWTATAAPDEWLLWDGSITGRVETSRHPRIVGVIKSHQTQYFNGEDQWKILGLRVGERSSVFRPRGRDWTPVYSWYLRLHPNDGRDVYFGLVRVEAAARPETIEIADEVSRWLLGERAPLSLPDSRWDRMIYPIRDCEQYLKSIAPSRTAIEAALAGL